MAKRIEIPSATEKTPGFMQCLRVAAFCRVSTEQEEQRGSLETQELYYSQMISRNPFWTDAGVFSECQRRLGQHRTIVEEEKQGNSKSSMQPPAYPEMIDRQTN